MISTKTIKTHKKHRLQGATGGSKRWPNAGHVVLVQWHGAQGATGTAGAQTRALQWRLGEWHSFGASQVLETNGNQWKPMETKVSASITHQFLNLNRDHLEVITYCM